MNVLIDVGNTRMKFAVFENGNQICAGAGYSELTKWLSENVVQLKDSHLLVSGSGDKGTPIVLITGYFDNYATE